MEKKIKIGDSVIITDDGYLYTTFPEWAQINGLKNYKSGRDFGRPLSDIEESIESKSNISTTFKVVAIAPHGNIDKTLVGISGIDEEGFIIEALGLTHA